MKKKHVLFICVHNSARSQMAEAFLTKLAGDRYSIESAGITPGVLNADVVTVMGEEGIDIAHKKPQSIASLLGQGKQYDHVITVCSEAESAGCPVFPQATERVQWHFDDPSQMSGAYADRLDKVRAVRDAIYDKVLQWVKDQKQRSKIKHKTDFSF